MLKLCAFWAAQCAQNSAASQVSRGKLNDDVFRITNVTCMWHGNYGIMLQHGQFSDSLSLPRDVNYYYVDIISWKVNINDQIIQ